MPTPNQLSLTFENNLVLNGINSPEKTPLVYDLSNGYNTLEMLMYLKDQKSTKIVGMDGKISKPVMGVERVVAQVATVTTTSNTALTLTFTDPNYNLFRLGETVTDGTAANNLGRVTSVAPGTIVLEPAGNAVTAGGWNSVTSPFAAGTYAFSAFNSSGNRLSNGTVSMYETPYYVDDYTAVIRESIQIASRDMFQTYAKVNEKDGFWWSAQDKMAINRFIRQKCNRAYLSQGGNIANSTYQGAVNYTVGLKAAIQDPIRGGVYQALTNPMTQGDFENFISQISDRQAVSNTHLTLLMGRGALRQIQSFVSPYIQYGGDTNTFGGKEVKGLDVKKYNIAGISCDFIMDPVLNDVYSYPAASTVPGISYGTRFQHTMVALDLSDYESIGNGTMLSAIEQIHFRDTIYGYVPGLIGNDSINASNVFTSGNIFAANDRDGVTLHLYEDSGWSFIANRMGWMELAS